MSSDDKTRLSPGFKSADVGTQLSGIYELDQRLASGGMGEVFRGHNIQTGDKVAIKIVLPEFARDQTILSLFRKEASILNRLSHDAIVRYHVFTIDPQIGRPYLAMEFVDGESVFDVIRRGPMDVADVRRLCHRLASGLNAAHEAGTIHRDLSPDNVILPGGRVDRAKIIDFGIARSATVGGETLIGGKFAGKYNYVSPEQLGLHGGEVSEQSDIYSLGLVLAAALRGKPLDMSGSQLEIVEKRRAVPDLSDIDPDFRPIIDAMLQSDPRERPASMAEIARATREVEATSPPVTDRWTAAPRTQTERAWSESGSTSGMTGTGFVQHISPSRPAARPAPREPVKPAVASAPRKSRFGQVAIGGVALLLIIGGAGAYSTGVLDSWLAPAGPPQIAPELTKAEQPAQPEVAAASPEEATETPTSNPQSTQEAAPEANQREADAAADFAHDQASGSPGEALPPAGADTSGGGTASGDTSPGTTAMRSAAPSGATEDGGQKPEVVTPVTPSVSETTAEAPSSETSPSVGAEVRAPAKETLSTAETNSSTAAAKAETPTKTVTATRGPADIASPVTNGDAPATVAPADQATDTSREAAPDESLTPATGERAEPAGTSTLTEAPPATAEAAPVETIAPAETATDVQPDEMPPPFEDENASAQPKPTTEPDIAAQNRGNGQPASDEAGAKPATEQFPTTIAQTAERQDQIAMNIPKPDVPATVDQMAQQVSWLQDFSGGDCFYATATSVTDKAISVEGFGTAVDPFMTLLAKFQERFKMEPDVGVRLIEPAQCEVTQFLHALGGNVAEKPSLSLDRTSVPNGFPISGTLETLGGLRSSLLLVDHKGMVFNLDSRIRVQDGKGIFAIPIGLGAAEQAAGKAVPQLLIAVTAPEDIASTALAKPAPVGQVLPAILDEVRRKGLEASAVAKYFQLGG